MALVIPNIGLPEEHDFHVLYVYPDGSVYWEYLDQCQKEIGTAVEIPDEHGDLVDKNDLLKESNIIPIETGCWQADYDAIKVDTVHRAPVVLKGSKEERW